MFRFLKNTLLSGLFVVIVVGLTAVILVKIVQYLHKIIAPIALHLPFPHAFPQIWAAVLLVLVVFLAGLALSAPGARRGVQVLERNLAGHIPLFRIISGVKEDVLDDGAERAPRPALMKEEGKLLPVFLVEETSDGHAAVFIPEAGSPSSGSMAIVPRDRVHLLAITTKQFLKFLKGWGVGSDQVLRSIQLGSSPPDRSRLSGS